MICEMDEKNTNINTNFQYNKKNDINNSKKPPKIIPKQLLPSVDKKPNL